MCFAGSSGCHECQHGLQPLQAEGLQGCVQDECRTAGVHGGLEQERGNSEGVCGHQKEQITSRTYCYPPNQQKTPLIGSL